MFEWHSTEVAFGLPAQPSGLRFSVLPNLFKLNVAEIYQQRHILERVDSEKSLIVDRTRLVLVSGKCKYRPSTNGDEYFLMVKIF